MKCASCPNKDCSSGKDCLENGKEIKELYTEDDIKLLNASSAIEARYYMEKTRIEEIILFSEEMGYKRIGLAFCVGLEQEARQIHDLFRRHFQVYSVCCKVCGISKADFNLEQIDKNAYESMCNPVGQASILNDKKTDLNIIVGLCIGHDLLFTQHSQTPVTTLVVKDRVLAHNPLGAVYSKYYQNKLKR
ncbi:MAG: putative metal-binding protein [Methanobacterium sp. Maddingley MBC34]|nr:MAG: putative metal-binding protein [Methanobacterium sp. Maddingley MBC34]